MRPLAFFLALTLAGCLFPSPTVAPTFVAVPDTELCPAMCGHFRNLGCEEGRDYYDNDRPGPKGVPNATCEDFCQTQQKNGVYVNPRCLMAVPACGVIEDWRRKDCNLR